MNAPERSAEGALEAILTHEAAPLGAVVGVSDPSGTQIAAGGFARSDRETVTRETVTRETAFDLASVTKVVATTSALLRLVAEDALAFDDPVERYAPETACARGTTLRELLQHRAGLWEWQPLYFASGSPEERVDALPLRYPPGRTRHYSDLGFMILGRVVAAVAGAPLDTAVRELVTAPLGLLRTGYGPVQGPVAGSASDDSAERRMAATGEPYPVLFTAEDPDWHEEEIVGLANDGNCRRVFHGVAGHAGLFGTAEELLTLGTALAEPERHPEMWHPEHVAELFRDGPDTGQALGWRSSAVRLDGRSRRMLWHPGFTGCALGVIPELGAAAVLLSNRLYAEHPAPTDTLWRTALTPLLGAEPADTLAEGTRKP